MTDLISRFSGFTFELTPGVLLSLIVLGTVLSAFTLYFVAMKLLRVGMGRKSFLSGLRSDWVLWLTERYLFPLLVLLGLWWVTDLIPLPAKVERAAGRVFSALVLLIVIIIAAKATLIVLRNIAARYQPLANVKAPVEMMAKIVLVAIGGMLILDNLGVSITPLLTTLGIGSLAVAIALQDTLGNAFAGLHIKADQPIEVGQFIRLENGDEGFVERIGWRSTRIRMLPNKTAVVPNSKLVQSTITNYDLPDPEVAVLVNLGVHYDSDLDKVERVTKSIAKDILRNVPGGVPDFDPFIRYHTFNQSSIDFTVILRARTFVDNYLIKHEFIKALLSAYRAEGIVIPFPIRTLQLASEDSFRRDRAGDVRRGV